MRSPVHTLCRLLNPLDAEYRVDGVFHPAYGPMHQKTAKLLGQNNSVTIKGDGGEAEIKPDSDCTLQWVAGGDYVDDEWPRFFNQRIVKDKDLDVRDLLPFWRGELEHEYGEAAVIQTMAVCLKLMGRASDVEGATNAAREIWQSRNKQAY